jgi:hypothetical protein
MGNIENLRSIYTSLLPLRMILPNEPVTIISDADDFDYRGRYCGLKVRSMES